MKMDDYQAKAMRTSPEGHDRVKNGLLGLVGESGELVDALKKYMFQSGERPTFPKDVFEKELGDILWYCAEIFTGLGLKMSYFGTDFDDICRTIPPRIAYVLDDDAMMDHDDLYDLEWWLVDISHMANRAYHIAYQSVRDDNGYLASYVYQMITCLVTLCAKIGSSIQIVAQKNIDKLMFQSHLSYRDSLLRP